MSDPPGAGPRTVAEAFLAALAERGVEWVFGNAGTDFAPVIEALAANADGPLAMPRTAEILHETVATSMAHGYWLMTGRPQCVMVHVNVGVANSLMGLMNASRGRAPMLFASGRTPITERGRLGSRNAPIHWGQEMFDQGGLVREFVKWDYELRAGEQVVDQVDRALAIAQAQPAGPVYLSLPREVLAETLPAGFAFESRSVETPSPPHPDPAAVEAAVALLCDADSPLVITSGGGPDLFDVLGPAAERFAIPVVQYWRTSVAISTEHPMYAGENPAELLSRSDCVVVLDSMVPWVPHSMEPRPGASLIQIGPDPLFGSTPVRSFGSDVTITSTVAAGLAAIAAGLEAAGTADAARTRARRTGLTGELAARREREVAAGRDPGSRPMSPEFMSLALSEVIGSDATVVNELGLAPAVMSFTGPHSFFGPTTSAGLGWGGGTALGAKLADPDRLVVWATGDGSYVFSNPLAVHHAAASLGLGLLTVVADNRVWNAVRRSTLAVYPEGAAARTATMPLSALDPAPDYPKFIEAYGGHGEHVDDPDELRPALERAVDICRSGRQALVSVHVSYPDAAIH